MGHSSDGADEWAEVVYGLLRFAFTLTVLVVGAVSLWSAGLLLRSFKAYYPHKSLLLWLALSIASVSCALLAVAITHSLFAWLTLAGLLAFAFGSLAVLEHVLRQLNSTPAPSSALDLPDYWADPG